MRDEYDYDAIEEALRNEESNYEDDLEDADTQETVLMRLVQAYDWTGVLARINSHPTEAQIPGHQGRKPLHVACDQDAPAVVIQALLQAFPEASIRTGTTNMTPLHITCSSQHASVHVVRVLLEHGRDEQCSMIDVDGDTPLHAACRCGAPIDVVEVLLRAYPAAVHVRDFEGLTPLLRLWVRYFVILGAETIESVSSAEDLTGELLEAWQKTELLLRCAHDGCVIRSRQQNPSNILHAAAAVDCPRAILKIATKVYPKQIDQRDSQGRTPLMLAACAPMYKIRDLSDEGLTLDDLYRGEDANRDQQDNRDVDDIRNDSDGAQASVIEILVQANASTLHGADIMDPSGRLALHMALEAGKPWASGIRALVDAYPESVAIPDGASKLMPFMLAVIPDSPIALTNAFELLRINPMLLTKDYCAEK